MLTCEKIEITVQAFAECQDGVADGQARKKTLFAIANKVREAMQLIGDEERANAGLTTTNSVKVRVIDTNNPDQSLEEVEVYT